MKKYAIAIFVLLTVVFLPILQADESSESIDVSKLSEQLYLFKYKGTYDYHHILFAGSNGSLLVDTGYTETADELYSKVKKITGGKLPLYLVITHAHNDHIQGNFKFKDEAIIISHPNTRDRFFDRYFSLPVRELEGPPVLVFDGKMTLYLDNQEIILEHTPSGHTDGDAIIYFPKENLLFAGDTIFPRGFPLAAVNLGGDTDGYFQALRYLIDNYPDNVRYLATHGGFYTKDQLKKYYEKLSKSVDIIKEETSKGLTADQIMNSDVWKDYSDWESAGLNLKRLWIAAVNSKYSNKEVPISINDPLTKVLMDEGLAAVGKKYYELKKNFPDKYDFGENQLNALGYELLYRSMNKEAIEMLKLNAEVYPSSSNVWDSLAEAYMIDGQLEPAIKNYEKSLKLDPTNANAKNNIDKINKELKK